MKRSATILKRITFPASKIPEILTRGIIVTFYSIGKDMLPDS